MTTGSGVPSPAPAPPDPLLSRLDRLIALLESLDARLDSVIEGRATLEVTVQGTVDVEGSVTAYEPR